MMFLTRFSKFAVTCGPCGMLICLQSSMAQDVEGALKEQQCEMAEMRSKLMRKEMGGKTATVGSVVFTVTVLYI